MQLENKLEYLRGRLREIKEQKTVVHQQLSRNNEGIGRVQSEISKSLTSSSGKKAILFISNISCDLQTLQRY